MKEYQLEYLLAVVEMKNFTYAAKCLNITQPTLSKAISTLEDEIGFQLFVRNRGGIILTDEGVKFIAQAKNVVREMRELSNCITRIKSQATEVIVGINPMYGSIFVPLVEKRMAESGSDVTIHWIEDGTYGLEEKLNNGSVDIAILAKEYVNTEKFKAHDICTIEEVLCVPKNHRLVGRKSVRPDELKGEKFVMFQERFNQSIAFQTINLDPQISSFTSQISTALNLVSAGKGVLLVHKPIYDIYKNDYAMEALTFDPKVEFQLVAVNKDDLNSKSPTIRETIKLIQESI